ncbi:hypothetical protein [Micromonospora sp. C95]|uniref:hypothetical protein n=1 Tax=Micromonospora sp. C95 TaxID=2824882 RepID=UPI001B3795B2|nr:hypothetical protein [Micromonospora sp. C95]MBQ1026438.1 hypothetical protein [Micromonospora sp. C95]
MRGEDSRTWHSRRLTTPVKQVLRLMLRLKAAVILATMTPRHLVTAAAAAALVLTLTACGSDAPTREEASREAQSAAVRQASASSAEQISILLSEVGRAEPLRPVAVATQDICHAGDTNGLWAHDEYRLSCSLSEIRYLGADGDLVKVLREVDKRARAAGLVPHTDSAIEEIERYYAANGRTEDGLLLPLPGLGYLVHEQDWTVQVGWSKDWIAQAEWSRLGDPLSSQPVPDLIWPTVFVEARPVDLDALRDGPLRRHQHVVTLSSGTTYHEVPWPASR